MVVTGSDEFDVIGIEEVVYRLVVVQVIDVNEFNDNLRYHFVLGENPHPCLNPSKSEWHKGQRRLQFGKIY